MQIWQYKTLKQPFTCTAIQHSGGDYTLCIRASDSSDKDVIREHTLKTQRGETRFFKRLEAVQKAVMENETVTSFDVEIHKGH